MITENERIMIKDLFSPDYSGTIARLLKEKGAVNRNGDAFSAKSVREALSERGHSTLEGYIMTLWKEFLDEKTQLIKRTKELTK